MSRGAAIASCLFVATAACGGRMSGDAAGDAGAGDAMDAGPEQLPDATFLIPYRQRPTPDRAWVPIALGLKRVDLTIVMDTTGSMQPSIENLKSNLSTHLLPALQLAVPSIGIA